MIGSLICAGLFGSSWMANHHQKAFKVPDRLNLDFDLGNYDTKGGAQRVKVTIDYFDKGTGDGFYEDCLNWCMGYKHKGHDECDLSCDVPCPLKVHDADFYPEMSDDDHFSELKTQLSASAIGAFAPDYSGEMANLIWQSMSLPLDAPDYCSYDEWNCWNKNPCSTAYRGFATHYVGVKVTFQYVAVDGATGKSTNGDATTVYLAEYEVPDINNPKEGDELYCICGPSKHLISEVIDKYVSQHNTGIYITDPMGTRIPTDMELIKYGVHLTFPDMNTSVLTGSNPTGMDVTFTVSPGTSFTSKDPESQNMMVTNRLELKIPSWGVPPPNSPSELLSELEYGQKGPMSVQGNAVCINMKKHAPSEKIAYTRGPTPSSALRLLGNQAKGDRILGPWTQTRFWIASDGATFADVQKAMFPKPTEGHYLRSLYDVGRITHVNFNKSPFKECLDPKVIIGASASRKATEWFVKTLSKVKAASLASWVKENPSAFSNLFAADAEEYAMKHGADVGSAMCASSNKEIQLAGMEFLMHAVPETSRPNLVKYGGLAGLAKALDGSDNEVVGRALDVAEAYRVKNLGFGLSNMKTDSAELKARATKLRADIKNSGT